jgi:hypothetical protein
MGEGTGGVDRLPSPPGRGVGGEGVQLLSLNQVLVSQAVHPLSLHKQQTVVLPSV